jgi:hypothetical protein
MDLIICFCILFIGSLLFWEFSKNLLIKTVENVTNNTLVAPKIADIEPTNNITRTNYIQIIQHKINEVIVELNKINKEEAETKNYISPMDDDDDEDDDAWLEGDFNTAPALAPAPAPAGNSDKVIYDSIKELDLSLYNGIINKLFAIQDTLNNLIDKIGQYLDKINISKIDISKIDISKIHTLPNKIDHLTTKLNRVITESNNYINHIYIDRNENIAEKKNEGEKDGEMAGNESENLSNTLDALF